MEVVLLLDGGVFYPFLLATGLSSSCPSLCMRFVRAYNCSLSSLVASVCLTFARWEALHPLGLCQNPSYFKFSGLYDLE